MNSSQWGKSALDYATSRGFKSIVHTLKTVSLFMICACVCVILLLTLVELVCRLFQIQFPVVERPVIPAAPAVAVAVACSPNHASGTTTAEQSPSSTSVVVASTAEAVAAPRVRRPPGAPIIFKEATTPFGPVVPKEPLIEFGPEISLEAQTPVLLSGTYSLQFGSVLNLYCQLHSFLFADERVVDFWIYDG